MNLRRCLRLLPRLLPNPGSLRVSLYLTCVACCLMLVAARSVRADIGELGLATGRQLGRLQDLTEGAEVLLVNGARFHHAVAYTDDSVERVLDRYQDECERDPGLFGQALRAVPPAVMAKLDPKVPRHSRNAIVRDESEEAGMLACFVGVKPTSLQQFAERLQHFLASGDLAELGDVRYVYAARVGKRTRAITLWTDSELNLKQMFPNSGDAAGTDSSLVPRPPGSRRTLTAGAAGVPFGLRMYESTQSEQAVDAFYGQVLSARGFTLAPGAKAEGTSAFVNPDGTQVYVSLTSQDGKTFVTLTEAPGQLATVTAEVESP